MIGKNQGFANDVEPICSRVVREVDGWIGYTLVETEQIEHRVVVFVPIEAPEGGGVGLCSSSTLVEIIGQCRNNSAGIGRRKKLFSLKWFAGDDCVDQIAEPVLVVG